MEGCGCGGFEQEEMRQQDNGKANQATEHREIHPMDVCVCGRERRLHNNNQMRLDWECAYGGFTLARFYDRAQDKQHAAINSKLDDLHRVAHGERMDRPTPDPRTPQFTPKSTEPAPRYDLIPAYALRLLAEVFGEGERKYPGCAINSTTIHHLLAEHNTGWWTDRQNHAQEHYYRYHQGDRTEPHLAKVMWYCAVRLAVDQLEREQVDQVRTDALSST